MEDFHQVLQSSFPDRAELFIVYDGHGGDDVVRYIHSLLPHLFKYLYPIYFQEPE